MASAALKTLGPLLLPTKVILYDAERDSRKQLAFCSIQSKAAEPYLRILDQSRQDVLRRFVFVQDDSWSTASTAALEVAKNMDFPWPLLHVFMVVPVPVRDAVYDFVAENRYKWFGRTKTCQLPPSELLDRFLDADELLMPRLADEGMKLGDDKGDLSSTGGDKDGDPGNNDGHPGDGSRGGQRKHE